MLKLRDDYNGLRDQLKAIGYDLRTKESKEIVDAVVAVHLTLSEMDISSQALDVVLSLLTSSGETAVNEWHDEHSEDRWTEFDYGNTKIGDYVRVKKDAYDSESGESHNGLVGKLSHMRGGKCTVEYIGLGAGSTSYHPMNNLESIKRV